MAKSKSFFGIRSGSTKSLTFSSYRGQQVTKDRVSEVTNPQTSAQMLQRMKLAQVAAAVARLEGLINHSFEGVDYGYKSVGEFRRINLESGALTISRFIPKGMADAGVADYIISRGTLVPFGYNIDESKTGLKTTLNLSALEAIKNAASGWVSTKSLGEQPATAAKTFFDALLSSNPYLQKGDQITFLMQYPYINGVYEWTSESGLTNNSQSRTGFIIARLVIPADYENGASGYTEDEKTILNRWNFTEGLLDDGYIQIQMYESGSDSTALVTYGGSQAEVFDNDPYSGCVILSRKDDTKDVWRRSSQRLAVKTLASNYANCEYTYKKSSATSTKYLNTGETSTGILGGSSNS